MQIFDAAATRAVLPYPELAESLNAVLRDKKLGIAKAPPRLFVPLGTTGDVLLVMPATDDDIAITKLATVHRGNYQFGLPSIHAEVIVMDAHTGQRLMMLDGATVTARRTAALSLLAAQKLAQNKNSPLLIVGGGVQGKAHLEAFVQGLGVRQVYISSKTAEKAQQLATYAQTLGVQAQAVPSPENVLPQVSLICLGTTSSTPVISDRVRDDCFVAAVGAYNHHMAEVPPALVNRAQVFVDSLEGAQAEAGDLFQANVDWSKVTALEAIADEYAAQKDTPIVFKSCGHALWDLAAARLAREQTKHLKP